MPTGFVVGAFELIGVRDLDIVCQLRERYSRLVVGVLDDESVERMRNRPPLMPLDERVRLISHVRGVDQAIVYPAAATSLPRSSAVFAIEHEPIPPEVPSPVRLTPRCESSCAALQPEKVRADNQAVA
ncbi:hypothetical protein [Epidermidibacterium keratini]